MGNKREKNPTFTYIKEFDNFSSGYEELISLIPQLEVYGGIVPAYDNVVTHMMKVITDNIPSPHNELYPNTLSFSISAKEVGFLTDDSLAFGWKIFINRKTDEMTYQFRVTFISLSMSKRTYIEKLISNKWKARDLVEKQSRFWHEASNSQRAAVKDGSSYGRVLHNDTARRSLDNAVLAEERGNNDQPRTTSSSDKQSNTGETSRPVAELEKGQVEASKENARLVYVDNETVRPITREEILENANPDEKEDTFKPITREEILESAKPKVEEPIQETELLKKVSPKVRNRKLQSSTQTVKMTSGEAEKNIEYNKMKVKASCSISKGDTEAQFNITHKGVRRYININDRNEGILLNRAAYTLMIENVVYNYKTFEVTVLDEAYQPESATNLGCRSDHVNVNLPDTAFVGEKAKAKFLEERGMAQSSGIIIAGKKSPKHKKNLVIDKTPKVESGNKITVRPGEQMIRVNNIGGPNL